MNAAAWTWILFGVSVFGTWLAGRNPRAGWIYNIIIQTLAWGPYALITKQPGLVAMSVVFVGISSWSLWRWRGTRFIPASQQPSQTACTGTHHEQPVAGATI